MRQTAVIILLALLSSVGVQAATCISSLKELEAKRSNLPALLQKIPVLMAVDSSVVTAAVQIGAVGDRLRLDAVIWKAFSDPYSESTYIRSACFEENKATVTFENGGEYELVLDPENSSQVKILGRTFKKSSASEFASVVEKVKNEMSSGAQRALPDSMKRAVQ